MSKLVIFGFGLAELGSSGSIYTSNSVMEYFTGLLDYFTQLEVFIPLVGTQHNFERELEHDRLIVHCYKPTKLSFILCYHRILSSAHNSRLLLFIPAGSRLSPILPLLKSRSRSIALYVADDPFAFSGKLSLSFVPGYDYMYEKSVIKFIQTCDPILSAGKLVKTICETYSSNVHESLPQGQPIPDFQLHSQKPSPSTKVYRTVLFLNRIVMNKGVIELLRGFEILCYQTRKKVRLVYTGDGDAISELKQQAAQSPYREYITFTGWIDDQKKLEDIWSSADVYILPSTHTEGRPRGLEEAIVRRVPSIATKVGGIPSEHGNGQVYLIDPGSPEAIAYALEKVLFDEQIRESLLKNAEKRRNWLIDNGSAAKQHARLILGLDKIQTNP